MTSTSSLGHRRRSRCSSRSTATSTRPRRTCRRRSRKTLRQLPPGIIPPSYQKVESRGGADPATSRSRRRRCRCRSSTSTRETTLAQRLSMVDGVAQVQVYGSQKYAVRIQLDPQALAYAQASASTKSPTAIDDQNVNLPTGVLWGPNKALHGAGERPARRTRRQFRALIVAYRNGAPVHLGDLGHVLDDVQNNKTASWYNGDARDRARDPAPAGHEHGRGRAARCKAALDAAARRRSRRRCSVHDAVRPLGSRSRQSVRDVKFTLVLTLVPRRAGDLPLPAQRLGDGHPEPRAADVDHRHVRGDVPARLQPRQPVADGAHARGRLRRRRRDRDAREHRPPHRDGKAADARRRSTARARSASRFSR